ncbi:MAG: hypothetical protein Q4D42_12915 [Eubacteriales bacterium]|nr:hypothetical protein [Eubacteriales bacterium]
MTLTNQERETIICFNEADATAEVFTYNGRMLRELSALAGERSDDIKHISDNGAGGSTYSVPKKWVKIRASRILTDEQRRSLTRRLPHNQF